MKGRNEIHRDLSGQASLVPSDQIICTNHFSPLTLLAITPFRPVGCAGSVINLRFVSVR